MTERRSVPAVRDYFHTPRSIREAHREYLEDYPDGVSFTPFNNRVQVEIRQRRIIKQKDGLYRSDIPMYAPNETLAAFNTLFNLSGPESAIVKYLLVYAAQPSHKSANEFAKYVLEIVEKNNLDAILEFIELIKQNPVYVCEMFYKFTENTPEGIEGYVSRAREVSNGENPS